MTDDELDELVLKAFRDSPERMRYSDVAAVVVANKACTLEGDRLDKRNLIEASVDRLFELGLLEEADEYGDFHRHWVAANPLDILANLAPGRRRRRRR